MRQVAAFGQAHAHDGIAWLEEGHEHRLVRLGAGIRLDVGSLGAEQFLDAIDRQLLGHIDMFATAVVALAGIALCILVGKLRTLRFEHRVGHIVLGSDQLDVVFLAAILGLDRLPQFVIDFGKGSLFGKHGDGRLVIGKCNFTTLPRLLPGSPLWQMPY